MEFLDTNGQNQDYPKVSTALRRYSEASWHIALIYKHPHDEKLFACHQAWHHEFKNEPIQNLDTPYKFQAIGEIHDTTLDIIRLRLSTLKWPESPYGINSEGCCVDETGAFVVGPVGKGFTCATAITAIFQSLGIFLLDEKDWPQRPEDEKWQTKIIEVITEWSENSHNSNPSYKDHIDAMKADIGSKRTRPPEVAASTIIYDCPTSFDKCEALADKITGEW